MRTMLTLAMVLWPAADALACGGFFCNRDFPIDQSGEDVVFAVDDDAGTVTTHVSIAYQGASEDFAWIVPVAEQPELFASSDALFTALRAQTNPRFMLQYDESGTCTYDMMYATEDATAGGLPPSADPDADNDGVTVVEQQQVGPYDTVVLQATSADNLLAWLNNAGYDLPTDLETVLQPYVADGQYFVALKLSAGQDTGDLVPLGMRYAGSAASVPIQLTSVAATPDMPLTVWVLGDKRAVPDNYLHVRINEAAIDWFSGGSNYRDVISRAADEAGGHGFATDFAGSTEAVRGSVFNEDNYDRQALVDASTPFAWLQTLLGLGLPPSAALLDVLMEAIPYPTELEGQGVSPQNFYDCLDCYSQYVDTTSWDATAATDILEARLIDGMRAAEALLAEHPHLTRMTSSLDAREMTVDPVFVFNGDMPQDKSHLRYATLRYECGNGGDWSQVDRTLVLSDGREIAMPSQQWVWDNQASEFDLMEELTSPAALVIEDLGADGAGEMMFDYRDQAAEDAEDFRAVRAGCGCDTASPVGAAALFLGLVPVALRRRRS